MKYIILSDGTRINNCNDSTTSNSIFAVRDSYGAAGAVRDQFTKTNSSVIKVYDEADDKEVTFGADLVLEDGCKISFVDGTYVCEITTRQKTEMEVIKDEITEIQDYLIEE